MTRPRPSRHSHRAIALARNDYVWCALTQTVDHTVDIISNMQDVKRLPADALLTFRGAMMNIPRNRGTYAIVGVAPVVKAMVAVFSRAYKRLGRIMVVVDTVDEGRAVLTKRRQKLSNASDRE